MSKPTKLYPIQRRWTHDAPHAVHVVETKAEADRLIASGAFTDNANDSERDMDAPDLTEPTPEPAEVPAADRPAGLRRDEEAPPAPEIVVPQPSAAPAP